MFSFARLKIEEARALSLPLRVAGDQGSGEGRERGRPKEVGRRLATRPRQRRRARRRRSGPKTGRVRAELADAARR